MRRREFVTILGGAVAAWPAAVRAQQPERMRRIGVLMTFAADAAARRRVDSFRKALQTSGWVEGKNLQIDERWAAGDATAIRAQAIELLSLKPDLIIANGARASTTVHNLTKEIPILFVGTADPIGLGLIASFARPGGNVTGFSSSELSVVGKMLDGLKEMSPTLRHVTLVHHADSAQAPGFIQSLLSSAPALAVAASLAPVRSRDEIERAIVATAAQQNGGLIIPNDSYAVIQTEFIIAAAARYLVPAIYNVSSFVAAGGLMSYGIDIFDAYRRAAEYADRILNGEKPADLPVQAPTKYELVINLQTAAALGLTVPPTLLARADEVIE